MRYPQPSNEPDGKILMDLEAKYTVKEVWEWKENKRSTFLKQELLRRSVIRERRTASILEDGRKYSLKEVDAVIDKFMKGKVK